MVVEDPDLLSNLTLNAIRHRMGVTDDKTRMKYDMLCSVMSDDPIAGDFLAPFAVTDRKASCQDAGTFRDETRVNVTLYGAAAAGSCIRRPRTLKRPCEAAVGATRPTVR